MILNPISKSTKGLTPEIIVTAPSGSTLDILQNSVVLQTYTLGSSETSHTFAVKSVGSYVVRGTSGSQTKSVTVSVDAVGRYTCTITYDNKLYLYNYGDECESITGGWHLFWNYDNGASFSKNSSYLYPNTTRSTGVGGACAIGTNNKIKLSGYSNLHFIVTQNSNTKIVSYYSTQQTSDKTSWYGFNDYCTTFSDYVIGQLTKFEIIVPLSGFQNVNNYIGIQLNCVSNGTVASEIYAVWLE